MLQTPHWELRLNQHDQELHLRGPQEGVTLVVFYSREFYQAKPTIFSIMPLPVCDSLNLVTLREKLLFQFQCRKLTKTEEETQ